MEKVLEDCKFNTMLKWLELKANEIYAFDDLDLYKIQANNTFDSLFIFIYAIILLLICRYFQTWYGFSCKSFDIPY